MLERSPHYRTAHDILGYGFPLTPDKRNPPGAEDHRIYWNAFIWDENSIYCWGGGDLDLTERAGDLQGLADTIGTIYATPEQPWNEASFQKLRDQPEYAGEIVTFSQHQQNTAPPQD